jgi:hypothetical protein
MGQHRVQSESFACNAYNFSHDGLKKNARWLLSLGINWFVPHGFHYSYDGCRKDDAGKSFFFQSPDYPEFHKVAEYLGRLGYLLGESRSCVKLCLLYPEGLFRRLNPGCPEEAIRKVDAYYEIVQQLIMRQIPFELTDETSLQNAVIVSEGFRCGCKTYSELLVPFGLDYPWLERFAPFRVTLEKLADPDFAVLDLDKNARSNVSMTQYRTSARGKLFYFFYNSPEPGRLGIKLPGEGKLYRCDLDTGKYYVVPEDYAFALEPYGAALFERTDEVLSKKSYPEKPLPEQDFRFLTEPEWDYIPALPELLCAIRNWKVTAGEECCESHRYAQLREIFGSEQEHPKCLRTKPVFDCAPRRKRFYPAMAEYTAEFTLQETDVELLLESETVTGKGEWLLNDHQLPPPVRKRVYDPWNWTIDLKSAAQKGRNVLSLRFPEGATEWDGLRSMVYVTGKKS